MILLAALVSATAALATVGAEQYADAHGSALQYAIAALLFACAGCTTSCALQRRASLRRAKDGAR